LFYAEESMSREDEFYDVMSNDAALTAILLGGIYQASQLGEDGITRKETPTAFDADGWLLPCALIVERSRVPSNEIMDYEDQEYSTNQVVEVWLYQDAGFTAIDAAIARLLTLFLGRRLGGSWELYPSNIIDRQRDQGALKGRSLGKMDWAVHSVVTAS
jgi:hypothetical protein